MYIKLVFESLCRSLIRFFDNRFVKNNDVEWYRMELEKQRLETQKIILYLLEPPIKPGELVEEEAFYPVNKSKFQSWESKRRELENQSRLRAQALESEARNAIAQKQSTAELEEELGIVNG